MGIADSAASKSILSLKPWVLSVKMTKLSMKTTLAWHRPMNLSASSPEPQALSSKKTQEQWTLKIVPCPASKSVNEALFSDRKLHKV